MAKYDSAYKGSQVDSATKIVLDSGITSGELATLHEVTAGTAKASKAVVLNENKEVSGISALSVTRMGADYLSMPDLATDPTAIADKNLLYFKAGKIYIRTEAAITQLKSGSEIITDVDAQTQVVIEHNFDNRYPIVTAVDEDGKEEDIAIDYTDENQLTIDFNSQFTGKIISRIV